MNILKWLTRPQSVRDTVLSLYKRGLVRGKKHDQRGAMDDYTVIVDMPDAPADVRAMARYNRALLYASKKDFRSAIDDLKAVLAMELPLRDIKSAARRTLDRMQRQHGIHVASSCGAAAPA